MKGILFTMLTLFLGLQLTAQSPDLINYQAIARSTTGSILANQTIGLRMSIIPGSASGTAVYTEVHTVTTDAYGSFRLLLGGGTVTSGMFAGIDWGTSNHFLQIEMDAAGGSNYVQMGTTQLVSVPYAKYADKEFRSKYTYYYYTKYNQLNYSRFKWVKGSSKYSN